MKRLATLLLLALSAPCQGAGVADAAVRVRHFAASGAEGDGSGTVLAVEGGAALVLTNRHVAPDPGVKILVDRDGERPRLATWLGADPAADLSALAVLAEGRDAPKLAAAPLAEAEPKAGVAAERNGHPAGGPLFGRNGEVTAGRSWRDGVPNLHLSGRSARGESGSGVFCGGKLVGVVWGGNDRETLCVPLPAVRSFAARVGRDQFPQFAKGVRP